MTEAQKRYWLEFLPAMALFLASVYFSTVVLRHLIAPPLRVWAALLPAPFSILVVLAMVRRVRRLDELERRIELEAAMIAGLAVGLASFAAGFLVEAHVLQISIIAVFPTMIAVYTIAQTWAGRRYR